MNRIRIQPRASAPIQREADTLIAPKALAKLLGVNKTTITRWRSKGRLPPVLVLSEQVVGWRWADIQEWLAQRERRA